MDPSCLNTFVVLLMFFCVGSKAADDNALLQRLEATEELVRTLSHRVGLLETREDMHVKRIADLESRDRRQQQTIDELQQELQQLAEPLVGDLPLMKTNLTQEELKSEPKGDNRDMDQTLPTIRGRAVQRIRQAEFESPVAFFVLLGNHFTHAGIKQIFVFDHIITNVGDGYNASVGTFTAPVEGIYVFSATMVSFYHVNAHASFYRNGDAINIMYVSGGEAGYDTTSATITLHLQKGDIMTVRNGDSDVSYYGYNHCSFTGFLLSSYGNGQAVIGK